MSYSLSMKFTFGESVKITPINTIGIVTGVSKYNDMAIKYYVRWFDDKVIVENFYYEWELEDDH